MSCREIQCCAITSDNKRCTNEVIKDSNHCRVHYDNAIKLYKNYKKICDVAYNFDLNMIICDVKEHINYILKCYVWLNKAFDARMKHRNYAFVPECYDDGHDKQFEIIQNKLKYCEDKLMSLYSKSNTNQKLLEYRGINEDSDIENEHLTDENLKGLNDESSDELNDKLTDSEENEVEIHDVPNKLKKYYRKRNNTEKCFSNLVASYVRANKLILERRNKISDLIITFLTSLYCAEIQLSCETELVLCAATNHMVNELYLIDYFEDFEPKKCTGCSCGNFVTYGVKLGCSCIFRNKTIKSYLNVMSEGFLKLFFELLLKNKEKILPLVKDLIWYYKFYGNQIVNIRMEFQWDVNKNRLVLVEDSLPVQEKQSKFLSSLRLKKKPFMEKYANEYSSSDDSD